MFKALVNKITALFAQPKAGVVVPVQEKVEAVMKAPIVEIVPELKVQPKKPVAKKAPTKKTTKPTAKKAAAKKK